MKESIRVAVAGVGNCASALVQGVYYYTLNDSDDSGLLFREIGGYRVSDIRFSAAFDVDARKVGKDLGEAIFAPPNNTLKVVDVGEVGVEVKAGPLLDGVAPELVGKFIPVVEGSLDDVVKELNSTNTHMLISYLPTGAQKASEAYAEAALRAGVAFINGMPAQIATSEYWQGRFRERGLPLLGDDVQNQLGATVLHKAIMRLLSIRGLRVVGTYQLNVGGTPDFVNLTYRRGQKERTKTMAVRKMVEGQEFDAYIAPVAHVKFLESRKRAHMFIEARGFAGVPVRIEVSLEVYDPWNNAGVMVDVIRLTKLALDRGIGGPLYSVAAWAFKNPPIHAPPEEAYRWVIEFIEGKRNY